MQNTELPPQLTRSEYNFSEEQLDLYHQIWQLLLQYFEEENDVMEAMKKADEEQIVDDNIDELIREIAGTRLSVLAIMRSALDDIAERKKQEEAHAGKFDNKQDEQRVDVEPSAVVESEIRKPTAKSVKKSKI